MSHLTSYHHSFARKYKSVSITCSSAHELIPQILIRLNPLLLTMLLIHPPETKSIHDLTQRVVLIVELNAAHYIEDDLAASAHVQRVDRTGRFRHVVAWLADPVVLVVSIFTKAVSITGMMEEGEGRKKGEYEPPVALDGVGFHLATVPVLAELGVWVRLQRNHVCAAAVLEAVGLDVDGSGPYILQSACVFGGGSSALRGNRERRSQYQ